MVSFANEDVEQKGSITTSPDRDDLRASFNANAKLTESSRAWDLDGDGVLDEAELALKAMDKDGKGTLDRDEMYKLMIDNLGKQRELFQMKKVVFGLVCVTCVLVLSNLGTSVAAAILSKDTTTQGAVLIDKATGHAIRTDTYANIYSGSEDESEMFGRGRKLSTYDYTGPVISNTDALAMLAECHSGSDVDFLFRVGDEETQHCICPEGAAKYHYDGDAIVSGVIVKEGTTYTIEPDAGNDGYYRISWD